MPETPAYPGVYIEEIPSGAHTIVGVRTSVAAFVDGFTRGPLGKALRVYNFGDFEREFGGLRTDSEASYAIGQYFFNGGAEAWVVRVPDSQNAAASTGTAVDEAGNSTLSLRAGRMVDGKSVRDPGQWGDRLRVDIDYATKDPSTLFNMTVREVDSQGRVVRDERFTNLDTPAGVDNARAKVNEYSELVQITADPATRPAQTGTTSYTGLITIPNRDHTLSVDHGAGSTTFTFAIADGPFDSNNSLATIADRLEQAIRTAGTDLDPVDPYLAGATVEAVGGRLLARLGRGGTGWESKTLSFGGADAAMWRLDAAAGAVENVNQIVLSGGDDGGAPRAADLIGSQQDKTGMQALRDVDLFNILCLPNAAGLGSGQASVYSEAVTLCEAERAFLIVDVGSDTNDVPDAAKWLEDLGITSNHAAVYFPRVRVADPLDGFRLRSFGASGTMAGVYARSDNERGVWKAPAGIEADLRGVRTLDRKLTDAENGTLNPLGINCLRDLPVYGRVSWGARTLEGADALASEWKYVPVRRLGLFIEESLVRGTKWAVFEPNDEPLWSQLRLNVGAFMHDLFRQGAFQGTTPQDAYLVKCDGETTTQDDIDKGIVNILVGFAPLKPAEFVIIQVQQLAGQIQE